MLNKSSSLYPALEKLASIVVDSIYTVHVEMGPGLLESGYEKCVAYELELRGLKVMRQVVVPVTYKDHHFDDGMRIDLLVENQIIIEVKSVKEIEPVHAAQILTYLKLSRLKIGFLVNFNKLLIKDGIKRYVM